MKQETKFLSTMIIPMVLSGGCPVLLSNGYVFPANALIGNILQSSVAFQVFHTSEGRESWGIDPGALSI